jgi:hypothetical protein
VSAAELRGELLACRARHRAEFGTRVADFIRHGQRAYAAEVDAFVAGQAAPPALREVLGAYAGGIRDYLGWFGWVGWNIADLAPPLGRDTPECARELAVATAAYAAGRLLDDALDDHADFKGRRASVVGLFRALRPGEPPHAAPARSALLGAALLQHALRRLRRLGRADAAEAVGRLFTAAAGGVLAESVAGPRVSPALYREIVRRKSVAYNMILYRPVLDGVDGGMRGRLLRLLGDLDEAAQLVNDLADVETDGARGQMNALTSGVHTPESLRESVAALVGGAWHAARALPPAVRDAVAAMVLNLEGEASAPEEVPCASSC